MTDELVTPENLSKDLLQSIFEAAFMETTFDDEGDLRVKEQIRCFVLPSETKDRIRLLSLFGFQQHASRAERLECVDKINNEYILIRASTGRNDTLMFDHDILVQGGVTKKNIVLTTKRFLSIPLEAINEHGKELVA